jgi:membrane peptidoglycan carboxypeptidase
VWIGRPDTLVPMKGVTINGTFYKQVYGGDIPAAIWKQAMTAAHEGLPVVDFAKADADVVDGDRIPVPDETGQPYDVAKQALTDAGFVPRGGGLVSAGPVPFGSVGYTSPRAGSLVIPGATITLYVSNGRVRVEPSPSPAPAFSPPPPQPSQPPSPQPKPSKKRGNG